ncbi:uncharacterized protein BT62DRAFT_989624 [Guyanagaster necrorhizus]|uniref:SAP domain-containing protein n=1 Tax=Guyanagaster necrorhizus TaxID=856835 RepID=A0A9P8AZY3_9AGAR|nr:uncharacterized protein BT62DRAFT_989624 [Guyanagaster necrorhizus MCA 3950]KAG7452437.1 hypothetical protein BT62DRAFT_989624 [Guyanagaster necrorhizus MCA 3950]
MLSVSGRTAARLFSQRRTFVSPTVLSQPWDTHSVSHLRQEARARGLSPRGNKSALIARLQEHEISLSSTAAKQTVRNASTDAAGAGIEGEAPGIPPAHESTAPTGFWDIKMPDVALPDPEPAIQIPYTPDFWESSTLAAKEEHSIPKILVVAGSQTHPGGGPSHTLLETGETAADDALPASSDASWEVPRTATGRGGFWDDASENLDIPYPGEIKKSFSGAWSNLKNWLS